MSQPEQEPREGEPLKLRERAYASFTERLLAREIKPGQFVNISLTFDNGQTSDLTVPVVNDDGQWAGLDTASPSPTEASSPTSSPSS